MIWAYVRIELLRVLRDPALMFFVGVLPVLIFVGMSLGLGPMVGADAVGDVEAFLMVGMAAYGAATASANIAGQAAIDRLSGWGRQLALSPLTDRAYVAAKAVVSMIVALVPIAGTFIAGSLLGVRAEPGQWWASAAFLSVAALPWGAYGLAVGLVFRSASALTIATGSLVVLAFLGSTFFPLPGMFGMIAAFSPLHGFVGVARQLFGVGEGHPLGVLVAGCVVWSALFLLAALQAVRRRRSTR